MQLRRLPLVQEIIGRIEEELEDVSHLLYYPRGCQSTLSENLQRLQVRTSSSSTIQVPLQWRRLSSYGVWTVALSLQETQGS